MTDPKAWQGARNILCIRLDSLGDVLMTSPALRALKESRPDRRLSLLTSRAGAQASSLIEEVDQTIAYDPPWMKATPPMVRSDAEFRRIQQLKRVGFDGAVIFTTFSQSPLPAALMAFMADIPLRLAYCRENPYQLLTDWLPETDQPEDSGMRHEVRRQLDLVAAVGSQTANERISLAVPPDALERARHLLDEIELDQSQPWIIIHPGASAPSRRYPADGFASAAQELAAGHRVQIVFTGTEPELPLIENIRRAMRARSFSLAGRLSLQEFSAAISLAPLLVSNNTGPVHIAAGVQTPVVDLYALTNPQHTPWMLPNRTLSHDVPCKYCYKSVCPVGHHHCLKLVPPQAIVEAALDLLRETRNSPVSFPASRAI
jgi:lipopolysaccharide heptosyltransferase II